VQDHELLGGTPYLVRGGGGPEQEVVRELAAADGRRRARARQELVGEQERDPDDQLARHALSRASFSLPGSLPAPLFSYEQLADPRIRWLIVWMWWCHVTAPP